MRLRGDSTGGEGRGGTPSGRRRSASGRRGSTSGRQRSASGGAVRDDEWWSEL